MQGPSDAEGGWPPPLACCSGGLGGADITLSTLLISVIWACMRLSVEVRSLTACVRVLTLLDISVIRELTPASGPARVVCCSRRLLSRLLWITATPVLARLAASTA